MTSRARSPYHDLGRWESERDLIQLDGSPKLWPSDTTGSVQNLIDGECNKFSGVSRKR